MQRSGKRANPAKALRQPQYGDRGVEIDAARVGNAKGLGECSDGSHARCSLPERSCHEIGRRERTARSRPPLRGRRLPACHVVDEQQDDRPDHRQQQALDGKAVRQTGAAQQGADPAADQRARDADQRGDDEPSGVLSGMIAFAMRPAISPSTIQAMIPIIPPTGSRVSSPAGAQARRHFDTAEPILQSQGQGPRTDHYVCGPPAVSPRHPPPRMAWTMKYATSATSTTISTPIIAPGCSSGAGASSGDSSVMLPPGRSLNVCLVATLIVPSCASRARYPPVRFRAMTRPFALCLPLLLILSAGAAAQASSQSASHISTAEINGDLRFLSSDLLEGRAPALRNDTPATEYIADQLLSAGL